MSRPHKPKRDPFAGLHCSICQEPVAAKSAWRGGNAAWPINGGRCCDHCNWTVVLPARAASVKQIRRQP